MKRDGHITLVALLAGGVVGLLFLVMTSRSVLASSPHQDEDPPIDIQIKDCKECHLDIANNWSQSPHAHAYDDQVFQDRWLGMGKPGECLACHTTNYQNTSGEYSHEGVDCEACHGKAGEDHPPSVVEIKADTDYCGSCHTTTLGEWRLTGHASADVGCMDCHDPHSQKNLFEVADDLCINCHKEEMGDYLEDVHIEKKIGCVDCHALVIPPDQIPDDGIVPTGHTFTITPSTCVACHTDTLHAGFSLPGYEHGAKPEDIDDSEVVSEFLEDEKESSSEGLTDQEIQALQAAQATHSLTNLFQGALVGLTLGSTTAWIIAHNLRSRDTSSNGKSKEE